MIKSLEKAFEILDYLSNFSDGCSLANISAHFSLPKSTAQGLLKTMAEFGYVSQSVDRGDYKIGPAFLIIGSKIATGRSFKEVARPFLKKLAYTFGKTTHLAVLYGDYVFYIDKQEGGSTVSFLSETGVGNVLPVFCTGLGKAILAYLPENEIEEYISRVEFVPYSEYTISDKTKFKEHLALIRKQGYATFNSEFTTCGAQCIAAPIFDDTNQVCAAINISSYNPNIRPENVVFNSEEILAVCEAARSISTELGFSGKYSYVIPDLNK